MYHHYRVNNPILSSLGEPASCRVDFSRLGAGSSVEATKKEQQDGQTRMNRLIIRLIFDFYWTELIRLLQINWTERAEKEDRNVFKPMAAESATNKL